MRSPTASGRKLGNTELEAIATPGHASAHHAYLVTDHAAVTSRGSSSRAMRCSSATPAVPTCTRTATRPSRSMARTLYRSITERLLALPDHLLLYPAHYSGSVCGRGLSGHPASTIGFERRHNAGGRSSSPRTRSSRRSSGTSRRRPSTRPRSSPPTARAEPRAATLTERGPARPAREPRRSSRSSSRSTPSSARWSGSSARPCR